MDAVSVGEIPTPPYQFKGTGCGEVKLTIVTTSHIGYQIQDKFSAYLDFEPVGLIGPVKLGI